jgi:hypothetical protein
MIISCTGHQRFDEPTRRAVAAAIAAELERVAPGDLTGRCNLAAGADQMFALVVLAAGGRMEAVVPSQQYDNTFANQLDRTTYECLLRLAETVTVLPFSEPSEAAFLAAGQRVVDGCDMLFAVWDGHGAAGEGGTADIVAHARARNTKVTVIWPAGSVRL